MKSGASRLRAPQHVVCLHLACCRQWWSRGTAVDHVRIVLVLSGYLSRSAAIDIVAKAVLPTRIVGTRGITPIATVSECPRGHRRGRV